MSKSILLLACWAACACSLASAQGGAKSGTIDFNELKPNLMVTPIFSEIVVLHYPAGFVGAFSHTNPHPDGNYYIQELVLQGETADQWSQMITTTGKEGLASNANLTPKAVLESIATGFKRGCPDTFSVKGLGSTKVGDHDAFVAWVSCGTVNSVAGAHSESTLLIAVKGTADYFTLQWAERGPASSQPLAYDEAKWGGRLKRLTPEKMCPRTPGEAAPYPSCVDKK
jgi:hypothetical protein